MSINIEYRFVMNERFLQPGIRGGKMVYAVALVLAAGVLSGVPTQAQGIQSSLFGAMEVRSIGPATSSGRVSAIEACYLPLEIGRAHV